MILALLSTLLGFALARTMRPRTPAMPPPVNGSEIAWMQEEFHLSPKAFSAIEQLHADYVPLCDKNCEKIDQASARVKQLAIQSSMLTDELQDALRQEEKTRSECREALLKHLYETAACMPESEAQRFLTLAMPKIFTSEHPDVHKAMAHGR